jgi:hypothetical protein
MLEAIRRAQSFVVGLNLLLHTGSEAPMAASHVNDPKHWRDNAAEMRALAKVVKDAETRHIMNRLADGWDKMADRCRKTRCTARK